MALELQLTTLAMKTNIPEYLIKGSKKSKIYMTHTNWEIYRDTIINN